MRVAHVITRLIVGGAQENTVASVRELGRLPGWDLQLVSGPSPGPEGSLLDYLPPGLPLTVVPPLVRPLHPWNDLRALQSLTRLFRARAPHVVHTHSGKAGFLGRLAAARAGVPIVVHTIHGPSFGPWQGWLPNRLFTAAERQAARHTTRFVSVAHAMTRHYLAAGIGTPPQYTCIYSGFDLAPFLNAAPDPPQRRRWGLDPGDIVIGKIARLFPLKGHDDLLDVAPGLVRRCPRLRFLLVGDGPWRARLERKARVLGLEKHVRFTGLVPPHQIPALVALMDILVHLSRREGLARALPQAMAAGKPVVACDCDGAAEVCRPGDTGALVPPGDSEALTARLLELAADPQRRQTMGRRGRALVQELFPLPRMIAALRDLYRELLAQRPALAPPPSPMPP
ncbi:MAG: glycosyltransferase family 4 protein [Verrucomicrobia bacterium]|nr:glycosyltransferase family 4 protein [Verrucomicrobiota bacterium]